MKSEITRLLSEKSFDELRPAEREMVLSEMPAEEYEQLRRIIRQAPLLDAEVTPPPALEQALRTRLRLRQRPPLRVRVPAWVAVACLAAGFCAALFITKTTVVDRTVMVPGQVPAPIFVHDTLIREKVVYRTRVVYRDTLMATTQPAYAREEPIGAFVQPAIPVVQHTQTITGALGDNVELWRLLGKE
jgi:hypothetical protein